ncbi:hypothetical protein SAY87_028426 [Trapa incisa]|uniref:RNB domain-containing protein n=1 Tax=Trapa incisa TaxID=236973 RepID=A0AAN7L2L1_9MYRT|nr:hypothetical protein SAY87_028426 [Trapa incisa]
MMVVRSVNCCSSFCTASSVLPLRLFRRRFHHLKTLPPSCWRLSFQPSIYRCVLSAFSNHGCCRSLSVESVFESVMEELEAFRKRKLVCSASRTALTSSGELLEDKLQNRTVVKGRLLEFKKDTEKVLLAVAVRPDGKKNWMVSDQNGVTSSIKPQQITFIVPGIENFDHQEISDFVQRAEHNLDPTLLEFAWVELLEKNKSVTAEELAEIMFGSSEPLESYCAHLLLSKDDTYFSVAEIRGSCSIYGPRPTAQVEELTRRKLAREAAQKELEEFVELLRSAKQMPFDAKPQKSSWIAEEKSRVKIESLECYGIDACKTDDQKKMAGMILKAMGLTRTASSAVNLLIDVGYFPVHVNLDLLKLNIPTVHSDDIISAAESILSETTDTDEMDREDLTHLKVYAIDVDEADELDDALSASRLQDGRIKVCIHVADPARFVQPGDAIDRNAMKRGTSIFLPTATYPMFPEKLAMKGMSLRQGEVCNAVTVSVVLHSDGSIAEFTVSNSIIKPTYMLTYESASELIHLNLQEEKELKILSEAASLRLHWRRQQGAIDTATLETRIKVVNPEDPEPTINLYVEDQADPAMRLVSEMMILCGEAVAAFGSQNNIPLPYRGQPQSNLDLSAFSHLPEGPVRSSAILRILRGAEIDFRKPIRHGVLGLPGYVQFTSPIRRYLDLIAHYQVKAFLRSGPLPYSAGQIEGIASTVNMNARIAKRLSNTSLRYWILEFLRRQPKDKKYRALVLKFIKDRIAALLLFEVGYQASVWVSVGTQVGDEVLVRVEESHPRDDFLSLKEVI